MTEPGIVVSDALVLPLNYVTERGALLAVSGAGKSNAARVIAEGFFECELPFVAIDPKGDWWGLRSGRDGKPGGGLGVVIFGGEHADVPLERSGGRLVADIIVDQRLSSIIDLSLFETDEALTEFLIDFGSRLYRRNRDPLHIFAEECDEYLPQKPVKNQQALLRVFERIVRKGRTRGLGITLISQRSAVVNKNVLTQAETLFAMRSPGPQDIAAIEDWMKYHGGDRSMLSTLAGLESGEAWVWSPHYLKKMERFRFNRSKTFDSGATPTNHTARSSRKPATLSDVNLGALSARMAETIERTNADDPKVLRKRIAELEQQLRSGSQLDDLLEREKLLEEELRAVNGRHADLEAENGSLWQRMETAQKSNQALGQAAQHLRDSADRVAQAIEIVRRALEGSTAPALPASPAAPVPDASPGEDETPRGIRESLASLDRVGLTKSEKVAGFCKARRCRNYVGLGKLVCDECKSKGVTVEMPRRSTLGVDPNAPAFDTPRSAVAEGVRSAFGQRAKAGASSGGSSGLDKPATAILGVLAQQREPIPKARLALLAGYSPTGGAFNNCLSRLRVAGWVEGSGQLAITRAGRGVAPRVAPLPTGGALIEYWKTHPRMDTPMRAIFSALVMSLQPLTKEQLVKKTGYKSAAQGSFNNALSRLRVLGLVHGKGKEPIRLDPTLEEAAQEAA